jgi:hypothetical protein
MCGTKVWGRRLHRQGSLIEVMQVRRVLTTVDNEFSTELPVAEMWLADGQKHLLG